MRKHYFCDKLIIGLKLKYKIKYNRECNQFCFGYFCFCGKNMQVILIEDIKKLGKAGDVVNVADGYARNFLLPQKKAELATPEALKNVEKIKKEEAEKQAQEVARAREIVGKIEGKKVTIKAKGEGEKLFGSVSAKEIAEKIGEGVREENIVLEKPIKNVGETNIIIKFNDDIETKVTLSVELK